MIEITIDNRQVLDALHELARRADDLSPAMREIAGVMADAVEENFEQEGRPKWPDLADSTKAQRAKKEHWPGSVLQVTGQLAASIQRESGRDHAVVGTNKVYAAIHQFGGKAGRNHAADIPARPFLMLADDDEQEVLDVIQRHLSKALR